MAADEAAIQQASVTAAACCFKARDCDFIDRTFLKSRVSRMLPYGSEGQPCALYANGQDPSLDH